MVDESYEKADEISKSTTYRLSRKIREFGTKIDSDRNQFDIKNRSRFRLKK